MAINDWFWLMKNTRAKHGLSDKDVYNFNKTEFPIEIIYTLKVVTELQKAKKALIIEAENQKQVTAMDIINAIGWYCLL